MGGLGVAWALIFACNGTSAASPVTRPSQPRVFSVVRDRDGRRPANVHQLVQRLPRNVLPAGNYSAGRLQLTTCGVPCTNPTEPPRRDHDESNQATTAERNVHWGYKYRLFLFYIIHEIKWTKQ